LSDEGGCDVHEGGVEFARPICRVGAMRDDVRVCASSLGGMLRRL